MDFFVILLYPRLINNRKYEPAKLCDHLAANDKHLKQVLDQYGYPPMWTRKNTFESLIHIILEQQVSLASALAALKKLQEKFENKITPARFLVLSDEELKACYFSRQKIVYARGLPSPSRKDNSG